VSEVLQLKAEARARAGKGASRAVRRQGNVPAVIYGGKQEPANIQVGERELTKLLHRGHFMNSIVDIQIDGAAQRTLPRDVQFDPVSDRPVHVDFLRVSSDTTVRVMVPVVFTDEAASPGLKRGAVLNIVRHEIELECPAERIPDQLTLSLAGTDIGASIHISAVKLPEGVTPTIRDRDFTIATIAAPSGLKADADAGAEGAAPAKAG